MIELVKKGIPEKVLILEEGEEDRIIHFPLGKAFQVHNPLNSHYLFEIIDMNKTGIYIYLDVCKHRKQEKKFNRKSGKNRIWFKLLSEDYYSIKDPPLI